MNLELIHKTALISGSTKDIGFAIAGQLATPKEMVHYGMTKTAQLAVSRGLAESCAETGLTVNAILPGPTHSLRVVGGAVPSCF